MNDDQILILTGNAIGNETAIIAFRAGELSNNGIDIKISVKVLEYEFNVETFFFGCNIASFLEKLDDLVSGRAKSADFVNYNETLTCEFIRKDDVTFLSLVYTSVLPQRSGDEILQFLKTASRLDVGRDSGSRFSCSFMPLHNVLSEISTWFANLLETKVISKTNPYP